MPWSRNPLVRASSRSSQKADKTSPLRKIMDYANPRPGLEGNRPTYVADLLLECGHVVPRPGGLFATLPDRGQRRRCRPCADGETTPGRYGEAMAERYTSTEL
jgi:hypothetical protein